MVREELHIKRVSVTSAQPDPAADVRGAGEPIVAVVLHAECPDVGVSAPGHNAALGENVDGVGADGDAMHGADVYGDDESGEDGDAIVRSVN